MSVGTFLPEFAGADVSARRSAVAGLEAGGIDHLVVGDHVSFLGGLGFDGLVQAAHLLALSDALPVHVGVYLLALRHPLPVARQLADLQDLAPDRLVLGVGIGGEDRHEYEVCGLDAGTRGARTDESLGLLRRLLKGDLVTAAGPYYPVVDARVLPPAPRLPIVVGGRSAAAVRRAALLGDGWLGIWVSPERFRSVTDSVAEQADAAGRQVKRWRHGLQVWCGFGRDRESATRPLSAAMEAMYGASFASFARYSPAGTPQDVAGALLPYLQAGCSSMNLIPRAGDRDEALAGVVEVRRLLVEAATGRRAAETPQVARS